MLILASLHHAMQIKNANNITSDALIGMARVHLATVSACAHSQSLMTTRFGTKLAEYPFCGYGFCVDNNQLSTVRHACGALLPAE